MAKETAEQKLLKLIEATDAQQGPSGKSSGPAQTIREAQKVIESVHSSGLENVLPVFQKISMLFKGPLLILQNPAALSIKDINRMIVVVILGLTGYAVSDFIKGVNSSSAGIQITISDKIAKLGEIVMPRAQDLSEYLQLVSQRNIFHPFEKKVVESEMAQAKTPQQKITEKIAAYKIVGISWLDSPESATVMIEDTKTQITHFKKTGDKIDGIEVKTIYANSVVLSYEGETVTVNL